uniref:Uncharacterized protein n=1 Tax=viral metagenome TaxID=1070528 RepID=A0A6C0LNE1_9ZZZZ
MELYKSPKFNPDKFYIKKLCKQQCLQKTHFTAFYCKNKISHFF